MNQYAASAIAGAATLQLSQKRLRRWKVVAGLVVVAALGYQFSDSVRIPQPVKRGVAAMQKAAVQATPAAKPVQQPRVQPPAVKPEPGAQAVEDRRREAAAAARARRRYEAEVRQTPPRLVPQPRQRVEQPKRVAPRRTQQTAHRPAQGLSLGTVLMTAAQAARVAEQVKRGRFNPSRELNRAARRIEREERRRQR